MIPGMIEKMTMTADGPTATTKPFGQVPMSLSPSVIVGTLQALGLAVPAKLSAAATKGEALRPQTTATRSRKWMRPW